LEYIIASAVIVFAFGTGYHFTWIRHVNKAKKKIRDKARQLDMILRNAYYVSKIGSYDKDNNTDYHALLIRMNNVFDIITNEGVVKHQNFTNIGLALIPAVDGMLAKVGIVIEDL